MSRFFSNFLLVDQTDRSKISSDHYRIFFDMSLYPLLFFANTPFKKITRRHDKHFNEFFLTLKVWNLEPSKWSL